MQSTSKLQYNYKVNYDEIKHVVSNKHSDHELLDIVAATNIGLVRAFSLNLLTRQCLVFRQSNEKNDVTVRINCPISWFRNSKNQEKLLMELKKENMTLREVVSIPGVTSGKRQLELIDLKTNKASTRLPNFQDFYLETKEEYYKRISHVGMLMGKKIQEATKSGEKVIFSVQELQSDDYSMLAFMFGVNSNENNHLKIICKRPKEETSYMNALLYDDRQFMPLDNFSVYGDRIKKFEKDFASMVRGEGNNVGDVANLFTVVFEDIHDQKILCAVSVHGDFLMMNQDIHEYDLFDKISDIAQKYGIIIAGDFNKKIKNEFEFKFFNNKLSSKERDIKSMLKSTEKGLQLHDTLDAIFVPRGYPSARPNLTDILIREFSLFKKYNDSIKLNRQMQFKYLRPSSCMIVCPQKL